MIDFESTDADKRRTSSFRALSNGRRRRLLGFLRTESGSTTTRSDLATRLAAWHHDRPLLSVTESQHRAALTEIQHTHLPALSNAGLIEDDSDRGIEARSHPLFELDGIGESLTDQGASSRALDAVFDALADGLRRAVLSVLAHQYHAIDVRTLARDVLARESDQTERDVQTSEVDSLCVSLVHVHLPMLQTAGLIDYDADAGQVSYEGHPELRVEWIDSQLDDVASDREAVDTEMYDVRTINGRDNIVTCGQSLCERADDELFMMFTTAGLLEEGCFTRIEDALERGVDVYVGSREPVVRDAIRERAPDVVLWEPQLDWLNLPPNDESVGRLVFADREAILLGTIGSPADDYEETAIYGTGVDNALVVLMRQLLGSRLNHLDAQSEDLLTQLPL